MSRVAHHITDGQTRTRDVVNDDNFNVDFASLLLSPIVQAGLVNAGFERPSPIQLKAIPLGRCGLDLIVQAKSGTGKTCVFSVIALEGLDLQSNSTQVLILAPTREIAVQIQEVVHCIGSAMKGLRCHAFIGGTMVGPDRQKLKKCHIAVGTPGRVKQLIEFGLLKTDSIRLFVLDEADKLLDHQFKEQVNWIYHHMTENKQMLALSATYPEYLAQQLTTYMRDPMFVRLNPRDVALHGIKQFFKIVPGHRLPNKSFEVKVEHLIQILSQVAFNQCLVFSNLQTRAQNLSDMLNFKGWPSTYISGHQEQAHRMSAMSMLKKFQCRILISTDLTARGIDAENVNLIVNLDVPFDVKTYYHRIGRAGRFGTQGAAITLASTGQEEIHLANIRKHGKMSPLPDPLPADLLTLDQDTNNGNDSNKSSSESGEYLDIQSELLPHSNHEKGSQSAQLREDHPSALRSVDYSTGISNDQSSIKEERKPPKAMHHIPSVDKGCQVKPSILSAIFGTDVLEYKIRPLSNYRTQRDISERWTYEKAKRDYEIFLDPSKATSSLVLQEEMPKYDDKDSKIATIVQTQVSDDEVCLDTPDQVPVELMNGVDEQDQQLEQHNSVLENKDHDESCETSRHDQSASTQNSVQTDEVTTQLELMCLNNEHAGLNGDCGETSRFGEKNDVIEMGPSGDAATVETSKHSVYGIENDESEMVYSTGTATVKTIGHSAYGIDMTEAVPLATATIQIPPVPTADNDLKPVDDIRTDTVNTTGDVSHPNKPCKAGTAPTKSEPKGRTVHNHKNHFGIGHTLSLIQSKADNSSSVHDENLPVDNTESHSGTDPVWGLYTQYLTKSDKKLSPGNDSDNTDESSYSDSEGTCSSSSNDESTDETWDSSTSCTDTDESEYETDDEAESDEESEEVATGESEQYTEDEYVKDGYAAGVEDGTFKQYGGIGQEGSDYWNDGQMATWQASIEGYYPYSYWPSTDYSAYSPYNQWLYPQGYTW